MVGKKILFIIFSLLFSFGFASGVDAAKLYLLSEERSFLIGQEFEVNLKVDTNGAGINAIEAKILFANNVLELLSIEKENSIFNFWLEGPDISNENGEMKFIGGTPKGVAGSALQIIKMKFKTKGAGASDIAINDAVVIASDGKGTNVLSVNEGINVAVGTQTLPPEPAPLPEPRPSPAPIVIPEKVVREPIPAKDLPSMPQLTVPLYPDPSKWYNHLGEVFVFWEVPDDVVKVASRVDHDPYGNPVNTEESLFTGRSFGILEEGVWYVHIQFKNNIGWGEKAHYKISLDMTPPLAFEIKVDNAISENPVPEISYETHDSLSGIAEYLFFIDGEKRADLSPQSPGEHTVKVRAVDLAGNSVEDDLEFEVLPLPAPTINFITKSVSQEELIFVSGKTMANGFIDVRISNKAGQEVFLNQVKSDGLGNWEIGIEEPLARGEYVLTASARDERGAVSYPTGQETFKVKAKTIISIGFVDLGWFEIALIILLLIIIIVSATAWYYVLLKKRRTAYKIIAGRDIDKLTALLMEDLKALENWTQESKQDLKRANPELAYHIKSMRVIISKMRKHLPQELDKLQ